MTGSNDRRVTAATLRDGMDDGRCLRVKGAKPLGKGFVVAESEALLDRLWAHIANPKYAFRHSWKPGDLLMWLNLNVLHRRDAFDPAARRIMHRSQLRGTERIA